MDSITTEILHCEEEKHRLESDVCDSAAALLQLEGDGLEPVISPEIWSKKASSVQIGEKRVYSYVDSQYEFTKKRKFDSQLNARVADGKGRDCITVPLPFNAGNTLIERSWIEYNRLPNLKLKTSVGNFYWSGKGDDVLGTGGNGAVIRAFDGDKLKFVALKCQRPGPSFDAEAEFLQKLQGTKHCPQFFGKLTCHFNEEELSLLSMERLGKSAELSVLSVELLGKSLYDLQMEQKTKMYPPSLAYRLMLQILRAEQDCHEKGCIHRDVTPLNLIMGKDKKNKHVVYLIDYGWAAKYVDDHCNLLRPVGRRKRFIGTARYASPRAHDPNKHLSRRDDVMSSFYVLCEMVNGPLPWHIFQNDHVQAGAAKRRQNVDELISNMPASIGDFYNHLKSLKFDSTPNYKYLRRCVLTALKESLRAEKGPDFDWQKFSSEELDFVDRDLI